MDKVFQEGDYVAIHTNPIWQDKSNFIIRTHIGVNDGQNEWEQLWVNKLENDKYIICCIPFFAYGLALGDEVETDKNFNLMRVTKPSGKYTFRVWFENSDVKIQDEFLSYLRVSDADFEWSSSNLLAISVDGLSQSEKITNYLKEYESKKYIIYEIS